MGIKIWWQDILPESEQVMEDMGFCDTSSGEGSMLGMFRKSYAQLHRVVKDVAREDTIIEINHLKHGAYLVMGSYLEMLNNVWLIDGIIEAEKQGYDAAIIGCGNDPGLQQARQAVDIPVIGATESGMLLASILGHKFGVITVMDELVPMCERNIRSYGLESRATNPVRVYQCGSNPLMGLLDMLLNPELINPQFENLCRECIADGAEVIVPACCALSPATSLRDYKVVPGTGVPVIDITQVAVKMAELFVDLKRSIGLGKSQRNWYKTIEPAARDNLRRLARVIE